MKTLGIDVGTGGTRAVVVDPDGNVWGSMQKAIALLRSFGVKKKPPGYKHLAPLGAKRQNNAPLRLQHEFAFARSRQFNAIGGSLLNK
jgi:glycerol kinase